MEGILKDTDADRGKDFFFPKRKGEVRPGGEGGVESTSHSPE